MCASSVVTLTAVLGGIGVLPTGGQDASAVTASLTVPLAGPDGVADNGADDTARNSAADDRASRGAQSAKGPKGTADPEVISASPDVAPAESGDGKRVVFSQEDQRVWLVDDDNDVERSYLVSGSVYDNLDPGTYAVFSRSEKAWGIDDSGTMNWFVRFAHGPNAAIGFHDIPVDDGQQVQTRAELGSPQSHGCIRQRTADALALWDFAPIGTTVVVI